MNNTFENSQAKILIVDDEPLNVELTNALLEDSGYLNIQSDM